MTSDHEAFREQLALRLYGELDAEASAQLEAHLRACAECTAFARELAIGLGAFAAHAAVRTPDDLPAGWIEALEARIGVDAGRARSLRSLLVFAAGLAAGLLAAIALGRGVPSQSPERGAELPGSALAYATNAAERPRMPRFTAPPPLATSRGQLAELRTALRR